jgi:hypothetical protein
LNRTGNLDEGQEAAKDVAASVSRVDEQEMLPI